MAGKGNLAKEVRAGLREPVKLTLVKSESKHDPLDDIKFGKTIRQHVREFACVFGLLMLLIAGYRFYKHNEIVTAVSLIFGTFALLGWGYLATASLKPLWSGWMWLAEKLGLVVSTVLMTFIWFLGFLPIAMLTKICGIKTIDLSFRAPVESYWETRDSKYHDFKLLNRQF